MIMSTTNKTQNTVGDWYSKYLLVGLIYSLNLVPSLTSELVANYALNSCCFPNEIWTMVQT